MDVNKLIADLWKSVCGLQGEVRVIQTGGNFWGISGNLGITPDYFLGTIEAQPLVIKTDSVERLRVTPTGNIGFKTNTPTTDFDFNGIVRIRGGNPGAGKILQSDADGVASWVTPAGVTMSANNGLTVSAGNVVFGQDPEQSGDPGALLSSREVPMGNNNIYWTTGIGKHFFGYPDTSPTPFFTVDMRGSLGVTQGLNYPYYGFVGGAGASINLVHGNGSYGMAITRAGGNLNGANLALFRTWGATADIKAAVGAGNMIGRITFQAVAGDNNSITIGSSIIGYMATSAATNIVQSWLSFTVTGPDGGQSYARAVLSSSSNMSITDSTNLVNSATGETDGSKLRLEQVLTGANAFSALSITPTWNTTGIPTAIKMNVVDTASDVGSLLMDIQLGGNSRFKISKTLTDIAGQVAIRGGSPGAGKVLTSDGAGVASWQTLPAGGTLTGADKGLSLNGTIVELGQTVGDGTNPALLSETRQIPMTIGSGALQFIAPSNALLAQTFTAANHSIQGTSTVSPTLQMLNADNGINFTLNYNDTIDIFRMTASGGGLEFNNSISINNEIVPTASIQMRSSTDGYIIFQNDGDVIEDDPTTIKYTLKPMDTEQLGVTLTNAGLQLNSDNRYVADDSHLPGQLDITFPVTINALASDSIVSLGITGYQGINILVDDVAIRAESTGTTAIDALSTSSAISASAGDGYGIFASNSSGTFEAGRFVSPNAPFGVTIESNATASQGLQVIKRNFDASILGVAAVFRTASNFVFTAGYTTAININAPTGSGDSSSLTPSTQLRSKWPAIGGGTAYSQTEIWGWAGGFPGAATQSLTITHQSGTRVGIGAITAPTAKLHLPAGSAAASSSPFKMTSGPLMTTPEVGSWEFLTDKLYFTITTGTARKEIAILDAALTAGRVPYVTTNGRLVDGSNLGFDSANTRLGIGTVSPGSNLHISTAAVQVMQFTSTGGGVDKKNWNMAFSQNSFAITAVDDGGFLGTGFLTATRGTGIDITDWNLGGSGAGIISGNVLSFIASGPQISLATTLTGSQNGGTSIQTNWNTSGTVAGLSIAITDTSSPVNSPGFIITTGGTPVFRVIKDGKVGVNTAAPPTSMLHVNGANGYTQLRMEQSYTPTGTADANGATGDMAWDADYIYIKTGAGWKRSALSTF